MNRHLEVIYCDDIRAEEGGKRSFMGVYTNKLYTTDFPLTLPKFSIHITAVTPIENPFQKLTLHILKDEEVLATLEVPDEIIKELLKKKSDDDDARVSFIQVGVNFAPLNLEEPCKLRVRADTESEELKGLGLHVSLPTEAHLDESKTASL